MIYFTFDESKKYDDENACPIRAAFLAGMGILLKSPKNYRMDACVIFFRFY